jgi:hypothetical protein
MKLPGAGAAGPLGHVCKGIPGENDLADAVRTAVINTIA